MRELKFRAWDKVNKRYAFYELINGVVKWLSDFISFDENREKDEQFTGLRDIDGLEIYCGDIVQIIEYEARYDGKWDEFRSEVFFDEGSFCYLQYEEHLKGKASYPLSCVCSESGIDHEGSHFCNVVGNRHENAELLNG